MQVRPFGAVRWTSGGTLGSVDEGARTLLGPMLDVPGAGAVLLAAARAGVPLRTLGHHGHAAELDLALESVESVESDARDGADAVIRIRSARLDAVQTESAEGLSGWARKIAHDYNNVFGAILGEADLLGLSEPDEETQLALAAIEQGVQAGLRLRERMVVLGRLSAERSGSADPAKYLARWQGRGDEVDAVPRPAVTSTLESVSLEGFDPGLLQLALEEVLDNAALAAGPREDRGEDRGEVRGGIQVDEGVCRVPEPGLLGDAIVTAGNWRWLRVADPGRAAAPGPAARLRRPGVSLWPDRGRAGMGLALASAALARQGGVLALDLKPGAGVAWLLLPVDDQGLTRRTLPVSESVST